MNFILPVDIDFGAGLAWTRQPKRGPLGHQVNRETLTQVHDTAAGIFQQGRVVRLLQQVGDQGRHFGTFRHTKATGGQRRGTDADTAGNRRFLRIIGD